jgi:hypothetical protein
MIFARALPPPRARYSAAALRSAARRRPANAAGSAQAPSQPRRPPFSLAAEQPSGSKPPPRNDADSVFARVPEAHRTA